MPALLEKTVSPSDNDRRTAADASRLLEPLVSGSRDMQVQLLDGASANRILSIPASALRLLNEILKEMAQGNAVTVVPTHAMLTTQEAADILNVSRPFLIGLLEAGKIPYQRLGSHRRVPRKYLLAFKERTDAAREDALRTLTEEAQELDMGY
jgi:excisionase family DNA binding protein